MSKDSVQYRRTPARPGKVARVRSPTTALPDIVPPTGSIIHSSDDVAALLSQLRLAEQEHLVVLGLTAQHQVATSQCVALGTVDRVIVTLRDVFRELVRANCAAFIAIHNHPSSTLTPSSQDEVLTLKLMEGGLMLGIRLVDHVIIAQAGHYSFAEAGFIDAPRSR